VGHNLAGPLGRNLEFDCNLVGYVNCMCCLALVAVVHYLLGLSLCHRIDWVDQATVQDVAWPKQIRVLSD